MPKGLQPSHPHSQARDCGLTHAADRRRGSCALGPGRALVRALQDAGARGVAMADGGEGATVVTAEIPVPGGATSPQGWRGAAAKLLATGTREGCGRLRTPAAA
jgi:hypothetical protein